MRKGRNRGYFGLFPNYFFRSFDDLFNDNKNDFEFIDFNRHTSENEGKIEITTGESEEGTWEKKEWVSNDGTTKMTSYVMTSNNFGKKTVDKESLKKELKSAVENEDYELAAKIKKQIDSL